MLSKLAVVGALAFVLTGCAKGLSPEQTREYRAMEASGIATQEKNPTTGALLGLLPGGGSFYAREAGFGVLNLLLWPASVLWDPVSGYDGSMAINYQVSLANIRKNKLREQKQVQRDLQDGHIDATTANRRLRDLDDQYQY